jgi:hypothetical protein
MGHEVIIYGCIVGARWASGEQFMRLQNANRDVIDRIPVQDDWPYFVRGMFALPGASPEGTYRSQVIHFGASFKDEPGDFGPWEEWLGKFGALLRELYWDFAVVHLQTEFGPERVFEWRPTDARVWSNAPQPVRDWTRTERPAAAESP